MKKWEKEIVKKQITDESKVIWRLRDSYKFAMKDVEQKIQALQAREQTQSVIYQLKYQQELQKQLEEVYSKMSQNWYKDIDTYLKDCYEDGFYSTMYSLHQEGIPIITPFNQKEMAQMAAQSDYEGIKLSEKLYTDSVEMARISRQEMTRGIASNESWATIAKRVEKRGEAGLYQASRIVRTESHRITNEVKMKTIRKVQEEGADIVKQWDSTVDKRTRKTHVELDGQLREIDQPFKIPSTGATAMFPGGFGKASEDIHCRCVMLQRARWALDKSEIDKCVGDLTDATDEQLQAWADKLGVSKDELIKASNGIIEADGTINHSIKAKNYNDFKKKYKTKAETESAKNQAQFEIAKDEKKNILGGLTEEQFKKKLENAMLGLTGDDYVQLSADWKKIQNLDNKISDLQKKLGIVPEPSKVKMPVSKVEANTNSKDWEAIKKNAVGINKFNGDVADLQDYHIENNFVHKRWENQLSHDEKYGIKTYTSNAYQSINSDLRKDNLKNARYKYDIEQATKGLEKCLLAEDTVVFRGMTGGIDDFSIWSGIPKSELSKKAVQDSLIGSRLIEKGFMSTGIDPNAAWSGLKLEVYLPKGTQAMYVDPISHYRGEREIVVQRNSTFEIKEVKTDARGYIEGLVLMLVEQIH